jgi:hypothetical protein
MTMVNLFSDNLESDASDLSIHEVINRIEKLNKGIADFWFNSKGWAPSSAATLLGKSRLDWQASLSASLRLWVRESNNALTPAELILGWVNLGSLIEGTLKTFLSVFYEDFNADIEAIKKAGAYDFKKNQIIEPDGIKLEALRQYFKSKFLLETDGLELIDLVQKRRNAVHAFQDKPIGNNYELHNSIRRYLVLLRYVHGHFPYPDEHYGPREV